MDVGGGPEEPAWPHVSKPSCCPQCSGSLSTPQRDFNLRCRHKYQVAPASSGHRLIWWGGCDNDLQ